MQNSLEYYSLQTLNNNKIIKIVYLFLSFLYCDKHGSIFQQILKRFSCFRGFHSSIGVSSAETVPMWMWLWLWAPLSASTPQKGWMQSRTSLPGVPQDLQASREPEKAHPHGTRRRPHGQRMTESMFIACQFENTKPRSGGRTWFWLTRSRSLLISLIMLKPANPVKPVNVRPEMEV